MQKSCSGTGRELVTLYARGCRLVRADKAEKINSTSKAASRCWHTIRSNSDERDRVRQVHFCRAW